MRRYKRIKRDELFKDWDNYQWGAPFSLRNLSGCWVTKCYEPVICLDCGKHVLPGLSRSTKDGNVCYLWQANSAHNKKVYCNDKHKKRHIAREGYRKLDYCCEIGAHEKWVSPNLNGNYNNYMIKAKNNFYGYRGGATA